MFPNLSLSNKVADVHTLYKFLNFCTTRHDVRTSSCRQKLERCILCLIFLKSSAFHDVTYVKQTVIYDTLTLIVSIYILKITLEINKSCNAQLRKGTRVRLHSVDNLTFDLASPCVRGTRSFPNKYSCPTRQL